MSGGKIVPRYFVIDFPDWVQIIAFDENDQTILVRQYRYPGAGEFLEFPGGSTKPTRDEDPLEAAKRELREETGYVSNEWVYVGHHYPNPALMGNKCHVYLARNCVKKYELELDPFEVLQVELVSKSDLQSKIGAADKPHSLMLATYQLLVSSKKFSF